MKEAHYFPHDVNAIQDPKMMRLLSECGVEGIGIFWIIIEILHQQECGGIAVAELRHYINFYGKQGVWSQHILDTVEKMLIDTKLLFIEKGMVFSNRVKNNKQRRVELSNKARENAQKRWGGDDAAALPPQCHRNADPMLEKKRKEKKEYKASIEIPTDLLNSTLEINDWLTYKKEKGQTYKPKGLEALWNVFRSISFSERRRAVDRSMAANWSGLYAEKGGAADKGGKPWDQVDPAMLKKN